MTARDDFEAVVWRIAGRRLQPLEIARIVSAADDYRRTARYRDDVKPCGDPAGYMRHRRRNEIPCRECLDAAAAREAERRTTDRKRAA